MKNYRAGQKNHRAGQMRNFGAKQMKNFGAGLNHPAGFKNEERITYRLQLMAT